MTRPEFRMASFKDLAKEQRTLFGRQIGEAQRPPEIDSAELDKAREAQQKLMQLSREAIENLDHFDRFMKAVDAIAEIEYPRAVRALLQISIADGITPGHRDYIAKKISNIGDRAVPTIIEAIGDGYRITTEAIDVLGWIGSETKDARVRNRITSTLIRKMNTDNRLCEYAAQSLSDIDDKRAFEAVIALSKKWNRDKAAGPLANIFKKTGKRKALATLVRLSKDRWDGARYSTIGALSKLNDEAAMRALIARLKDRDDRIRGSTAMGIGFMLGDRNPRQVGPAVTALIEQIRVEKNPHERGIEIGALCRIGKASRPAIPLMLEVLRNRSLDERQRELALMIISGFKRKDTIAAMAECLEDKNVHMRLPAAIELAKFGDIRAMPALMRALWRVPGQFGYRSNCSPELVVKSFSNFGDEAAVAVPLLSRIIAAESVIDAARVQAIKIVGNLKDKRAIPALVKYISRPNLNERSVKFGAVDSLVMISRRRAAAEIDRIGANIDFDSPVREVIHYARHRIHEAGKRRR